MLSVPNNVLREEEARVTLEHLLRTGTTDKAEENTRYDDGRHFAEARGAHELAL